MVILPVVSFVGILLTGLCFGDLLGSIDDDVLSVGEEIGKELLHESPERVSTLSHELHISVLDRYVNTDEGQTLLKNEFKSIPGGARRTQIVGSMPENIKKNRYEELPAFDDTRVILKKLHDDPHSDYINANYIDGYNRNKEYVATQGPIPETVNDFWRMIWQLNSRKIVMLANLFEDHKPKVAKYWPDTNETYGDILVTKLSEHAVEDIQHVVRTFSIKKAGKGRTRIVRHFHFTGWPDLGVPSDRLAIVSLLRQARAYRPHDTVPIVVHCSAGVGRTGTVIMTDSMLQMAQAEQKVNFAKRLNLMRQQRVDVVEKEGQYVFGHEAVYDLFYGNNTAEYLKRVDDLYAKMTTPELEDVDVPADMAEGLRRMKQHAAQITRLVEDMIHMNEA